MMEIDYSTRLAELEAEFAACLAALDYSEAEYHTTNPVYSPYERMPDGQPIDEDHASAWLTDRMTELHDWKTEERQILMRWNHGMRSPRRGFMTRVNWEGKTWAAKEGRLNSELVVHLASAAMG